jgi:cytochrome c oxidase subunit II
MSSEPQVGRSPEPGVGETKGTPSSGGSFFSRPSGKVFIIWLVLTAIGIVIGVIAPQDLLPPMLSVQGHTLIVTMILFTVLAAPVAAVVYAIGIYSLLAWRRGSQDEPPPDGPPIRGNSTVTTVWLLTSSVLVMVLLVWGLGEYTAESAPHSDALQVNVTGQQWLWTFSYPGTGVSSRTLMLPVDRPVQFNVTSVDVTHGFWLPDLGVQVDANPGEVTVIEATPDKLGSFVVRCSQLCGLYHSFMWTSGSVVSPANFSQWLQTQGAPPGKANQVALAAAVKP